MFLNCALERAADGVDIAAEGEGAVQFGVDGEEVGCEAFFWFFFFFFFFVLGGGQQEGIIDDASDPVV